MSVSETICIEFMSICNSHRIFFCSQGRHDLSEALLVQSEMMEHDQYVQEGNVFPFGTSGGDEPMGGQEYWGSNPNPSGLAP